MWHGLKHNCAVIAELAIAGPEKYAEIQNKQGEKLASITQKCQVAQNTSHEIEEKLLPIRK